MVDGLPDRPGRWEVSVGVAFGLVLAGCQAFAGAAVSTAAAGALRFVAHSDGGYAFDTGVLKGRLRRGGQTLGLQDVVHVPSGTRLDRSNGLLGHYRVFGQGRRWGDGAWSWPGTARLLDDGGVEARWEPAGNRRFGMVATYRWYDAATVEMETSVTTAVRLTGFEVFVASYFHESFTNAAVAAGPAGWTRTERSAGDWQIFPRDVEALAWIRDGRWRLEPHPVAWVPRPFWSRPLARRVNPATGLTGALMAARDDCFAVALPHEEEAHFSVYLSLFGRDLRAGETVRARTWLWIGTPRSADELVERHGELTRPR